MRRLSWVAFIAAVLVPVVAGWALTSQSALVWALARLSASLDGRLVVAGAKRTGVVALTIERVRYTDPELSVTVRDADIDVQFMSLLRGRVQFRSLSVASLEIEAAPARDGAPTDVPQALTLPLSVEVQTLHRQRGSRTARRTRRLFCRISMPRGNTAACAMRFGCTGWAHRGRWCRAACASVLSDRLAFDAEVPNARLIHADARGGVRATGPASGTFGEPAFAATLTAADVRVAERFAAGRIRGEGTLEAGGAGRVDTALSASVLRAADATLTDASVTVQGLSSRHVDSIPMRAPEPRPSRQRSHVGKASIEVARTGRIELAQLDCEGKGGLTTRGAFSELALAALEPRHPVPGHVRELSLSGPWDAAMTDTLAGTIGVRRDAGDMTVPGKPPLQAKLQALSVDVRADDGIVRFGARTDSATFGLASAHGVTRAQRRGGRWGIPGDAPIQARLHADMPSLDWTRPLLLEVGIALAGQAEIDLRVAGRVARPVYDGHVVASGLSADVPDLGLTLRDGRLDAVFDGERLSIRMMRFVSGDGALVGSVAARLVPGDLSAQIALTAQKRTLLARHDRLAVISGEAAVAWNPRRLTAKGQFTADRGVVELPREDTPRPSSDVVVPGTKAKAPRPLDVEADLSLDLGWNFSLRGEGLDTRLAATMRGQMHPKAGLSLIGSVRAVDYTYIAFGRRWSIKSGTVTFAGPVGNPALDILAARVVSDVEVGAAVGGTALVPQIRLASTPAMPDANELAWLALGHGLDEVGNNETAVLQAAAFALLSRVDTDSKGILVDRFGLDDLSLGTASGTGERVVRIGKRFASNFHVGFERGITGAAGVIRITYDLSRR